MMSWIKSHKVEVLVFLFVIAAAAFLRFYRLEEFMTFLGDEGRDALMIKRTLVDLDPPLIGPTTSVGNIYLGPLYYYMMTVPMAIFWLNPVAAAGMVALLGVATVALIYYLTRDWFGRAAAVICAFLYAISPITIIYSRSSWNPNPAPFFTLLNVLGLYLIVKKGQGLFLLLSGFALGAVIQMHYLALILLPITGVIWLYLLFLKRRKLLKIKNFWAGTIGAVLIFFAVISPWIVFDLKHDFLNFRALQEFFANRETTVNINPLNAVGRAIPIYSHNLVTRYMTGNNAVFGYSLSAILLMAVIKTLLTFKERCLKNQMRDLTLVTWLVVGVVGLTLYKQTVYDHYLGFINPLPYFLLGLVISTVLLIKEKKRKIAGAVIIAVLVMALTAVNLQNNPLQGTPNNQLKRTQQIARFITERSEDQPFNFALIAKHNYDAAYQFYLDVWGYKPQKLPFETADQLFVVCEDAVCNPVGHPKYEIAAFGWTKIEYEKEIDGVKLFKLVHNPNEKIKND